jgi:hypothetical protein
MTKGRTRGDGADDAPTPTAFNESKLVRDLPLPLCAPLRPSAPLQPTFLNHDYYSGDSVVLNLGNEVDGREPLTSRGAYKYKKTSLLVYQLSVTASRATQALAAQC